jgi:hypothetical protein
MLRRWADLELEYITPLPFLVQSKLNSVATAHCNVRCFQSLAAVVTIVGYLVAV